MHGTIEASKMEGWVCVYPWTHISPKRTHILIAKVYLALEEKYYYACPKRDRLVGKDHRSSPIATHKEDNQKTPHAPTSLHNGSPYVHATGLANLNTSISQFHNYSTSMTLISPPLYRKTIARNQTYHIQRSTSLCRILWLTMWMTSSCHLSK